MSRLVDPTTTGRLTNEQRRELTIPLPILSQPADFVSFDLIAPVYDTLSRLVFGRSLEHIQLRFLADLPRHSTILIVGGGTGFQLAEVLNAYQPTRVLFLEASEKMLEKARRRVVHHPLAARVEFRHGTETSLGPDESFDRVLLSFVLDVSPDNVLKTRFIPVLLRATVPGGRWLVTDFIQSPKLYHRLILLTMYRFFRLVSGLEARQLPHWQLLLAGAGLLPGKQEITPNGQLQTGWWAKPLS